MRDGTHGDLRHLSLCGNSLPNRILNSLTSDCLIDNTSSRLHWESSRLDSKGIDGLIGGSSDPRSNKRNLGEFIGYCSPNGALSVIWYGSWNLRTALPDERSGNSGRQFIGGSLCLLPQVL